MATDFYDTLGIARDASADDVQRAYRRLARRYHPDVNSDPGAEERFKEVSEAYQVLSDPEQRGRYDRFGVDFRRVAEDAGRSRRTSAARGFQGIDIEDLLSGLFRGRGRVPGADQEAVLELSVEEAYRGGHRRLTLPNTDRRYDVMVPPGVVDGQRIRLAGQGGRGAGDAPAGDLYLVVRIRPHRRYRLSGRDIHLTLPVTPWEAALGTTVSVTTPGGEVKVRVTAGSSSGRRLRLRGEGMPNPRGTAGDLYAEVRVMVPQHLTRRERKLFEELAAVSEFTPRRT
ncbi:DnaJ C-terminal domain-containing protein [Kutzneria viridogrisea]|uniref:Curved DNA-binding protein n=1 Tax=Kutzneria viridogrisea TaxID=47990 RepID=A0ABR6BA81_9PSEU|nr:curved DNA-binding protein [Kutzneria viridogrisea]